MNSNFLFTNRTCLFLIAICVNLLEEPYKFNRFSIAPLSYDISCKLIERNSFDKVTKIREQCQKQEETIREQETELDSKRGELQKLKDEESSLEKEYEDNKRKLDKLSKSLQDTQLQICQVK